MYTRKLSLSLLLLASVIALAVSQPKFPKGFPKIPKGFPTFPPKPKPAGAQNSPGISGGLPGGFPVAPPSGLPSGLPIGLPKPPLKGLFSQMFLTYCQLSYPKPFSDPSIIPTPFNNFPFAAAQRALFKNSDARLFLASKRQLNAARAARRASDAGRAVSSGRSKRSGDGAGMAHAFLTPTGKESLCQSVEREVTSVLNAGDVCYAFPEQDTKYWECATNHASMANALPQMQRYYCSPDNYAFTTIMVFCPGSALEPIRWHTVSIPLNCCCKRYYCDFKSYASIGGPKTYP